MATRTRVLLIDDVDGTPATTNVQFALDGTSWEIDLSDANVRAFRDQMARWTRHARRTGVTVSTAGRVPARRDPEQSARIRRWANDAGLGLGARGRITQQVEDAYEEAHRPVPRT